MIKRKLSYEECHKEIDGILHKFCKICEKWFPATQDNFYPKNTKEGLSPYCKECEKKKNSQWGKDNPDKRKVYLKKDYQRPKTKNYLIELSKRRRENGEQLKWQRNNKDKLKGYHEIYSNKVHKITKEEWTSCKEYFNNECAYCGLSVEEHYNRFNGELRLTDLHKEHVDCNGSDDLSNCIPSCKSCNTSKHTENMESWYKRQAFFSGDKLNKIHKWLNEDYKKYIYKNVI